MADLPAYYLAVALTFGDTIYLTGVGDGRFFVERAPTFGAMMYWGGLPILDVFLATLCIPLPKD